MPYAPGTRRPNGLTDAEVFAWFMPGEPPPSHECWDWPAGTCYGYGALSLRGRPYRAHFLSYEVHHGPREGLHVLHSCDRPICVQPPHLHLGTSYDNVAEMVERGRNVRGERVGTSRLTADQVQEIRASRESQRVLADRFGVHQTSISLIKQGKNWAHVSGDNPQRGNSGEEASQAKLTWENVRWIRQSSLTQAEMARALGVSATTVCEVRSGKTWREH